MSTHSGYWLGSLMCCGVLTLPALAAGQSPAHVPIHGVTGTIATPQSVGRFYGDLHKTIEKTGEGIDHVRGEAKPKSDGEGASLESLRPGTPVVVHYSVKGIQASANVDDGIESRPNANEGVVTSVDRSSKRITIRFAGGATETLRFTRDTSGKGRVIVSYPDQSGKPVPHYFKPVS